MSMDDVRFGCFEEAIKAAGCPAIVHKFQSHRDFLKKGYIPPILKWDIVITKFRRLVMWMRLRKYGDLMAVCLKYLFLLKQDTLGTSSDVVIVVCHCNTHFCPFIAGL
jgi:hypothetical protein